MLARLRKVQEENEGGFTLIELLVVVIIIGILAAIAIPTFLNQREKAWQKAAQSDLRNAATVLEEHFSDAGAYTVTAAPPITAANFKASDNVVMRVFTTADDATTATVNEASYCLDGDHSKLAGTGVNYKFAMATGKPVADSTGCTGTAALTVGTP